MHQLPTNPRKFQKGQSGNPGGRPKIIAEIRDLARSAGPEAIETLAIIMRDKKASPAARIAAANAILDRGYGRPAQSVELRTPPRDLMEISDEELFAIVDGVKAGDQAWDN